MKTRLCAVLAAALLLSLAGCSSSLEAAPDNSPAVSAPAQSVPAASETPVRPALEEVADQVFLLAEEEGLQGAEDAWTRIQAWYDAGEDDPAAIFQLLKEQEVFRAPSQAGILVVRVTSGSSYRYKSTGTSKCTTFTLALDCIDPESGAVSRLKTFSSEETHSCSLAYNGLGLNTVQTRLHFSQDLSKVAAELTMEDGTEHVGWLDESGSFTDVTARIAVSSDFGGLLKHRSPCFGPDGYLYFRDLTNTDAQIKRVPMDDLRPEAVEVVVEDDHFPGAVLTPFPDGSVDEDLSSWYYYDASLSYPASGGEFADWISPDSCVGVRDGMIYRYTLSGQLEIFGWDLEQTALVPEVKGRENTNPVVSPDGSQVAFLSRLTSGTDQAPHLFVVPLSGGEPRKIQTEYSFSSKGTYLMDWVGEEGSQTSAPARVFLTSLEPVRCDEDVVVSDTGIGRSNSLEQYSHYLRGEENGVSVQWELDGSYTTLTGIWTVCNRNKNSKLQEYFEVYADGKLVYTSPVLSRGNDPVTDVVVDIRGCRSLEIVFPQTTGRAELGNVLLTGG